MLGRVLNTPLANIVETKDRTELTHAFFERFAGIIPTPFLKLKAKLKAKHKFTKAHKHYPGFVNCLMTLLSSIVTAGQYLY